MKKTVLGKLTSFLLAIIVIMSLCAVPALAADAATELTPAQIAQQEAEKAIAEFKAEIIRLVNIERKNAGVAELEELEIVSEMADVRAKEAAVSFKHTRPNGTRCFTIFGENELTYKAAGENLARGFSSPEKVVKAWMNSASHSKNILDPDFKFIGIGYFVNADGRVHCTQLFYTPKASTK